MNSNIIFHLALGLLNTYREERLILKQKINDISNLEYKLTRKEF